MLRTHQPAVGQNHLTQSLFYNKVLTILYKLLNTVLKVRNRMAVWVWMVVRVYIICLPSWSHVWPELWLAATAQYLLQNTSPEDDQNSKLKLRFLPNTYCFCPYRKVESSELWGHLYWGRTSENVTACRINFPTILPVISFRKTSCHVTYLISPNPEPLNDSAGWISLLLLPSPSAGLGVIFSHVSSLITHQLFSLKNVVGSSCLL